MSTDEFLAKAEHRVKGEGVGLIVIDYAQLMSADKKLYPNQVSELEAISKCIRSTARKLSVPDPFALSTSTRRARTTVPANSERRACAFT